MSKRRKGGKGKGNKSSFKASDDTKLQALLIADSFDEYYKPITLELPRALLPLVNIPMIDYSIDFLSAAGVKEVFVLCNSHAAMIQEHLKERYSDNGGMKVTAFTNKRVESVGDVLREMYKKSLIQSEFILMRSDVVANVKLDDILKAHKERRRKDKSTLLTMVFKSAGPGHRTRSEHEDLVIAINKDTSQLLLYEDSTDKQKYNVDKFTIKASATMEFRHDVYDCKIAICAPELLYQLEDNFDYSDINSFVRGVLGSELEFLNAKIFAHIIESGYAARAHTFKTYTSVTKDIIHRWTYPMTPDSNFLADTSYKMYRPLKYFEKDVKLARSCKIGDECVIGKGTSIGSNSIVNSSTIGRDCSIGENVSIENCYIWDKVTIADGVKIKDALICSRASLGQGITIPKGCVISFGVELSEDVGDVLQPFDKITTIKSEDTTEQTISPNSNGYLWRVHTPKLTELVPREYAEEWDMEEEQAATAETVYVSEDERFRVEVQETIARALEENHSIENLRVEINGLKTAFPLTTWVEVAATSFTALMNSVPSSATPTERVAKIGELLERWGELFVRFSLTVEDQVDFIFQWQEICDTPVGALYAPLFQFVLNGLYDHDIIEEDAVLKWKEEVDNAETEEDKKYLKKCTQFIEWIMEAEEESDEDESDEEDSDE